MPAIPSSIAEEHHELHETLAGATREAGALGAAARELEEALAPHFRREEEIASPARRSACLSHSPAARPAPKCGRCCR